MNHIIPQSTIATRLSRIANESRYQTERMMICLAARVAQAAACLEGIFSASLALGAIFIGSVSSQTGFTVAISVFTACVFYDLTRCFGNIASMFSRRLSGSDYSLREVGSFIIQGLGIDKDTAEVSMDFLDAGFNVVGVYDAFGEKTANDIVENTLMLRYTAPFIAKILNQRIP